MASNYSHFTRVSTPLVRATAVSAGTLNVSAALAAATLAATTTVTGATLVGTTTVTTPLITAAAGTITSASVLGAINIRTGVLTFSNAAGTYAYAGIAADDVIIGTANYFKWSAVGAAQSYGAVDLMSVNGAGTVHLSMTAATSNALVFFNWIDISV